MDIEDIKKYLKKLNITHNQIALQMGLTRPHVSAVLNNKLNIMEQFKKNLILSIMKITSERAAKFQSEEHYQTYADELGRLEAKLVKKIFLVKNLIEDKKKLHNQEIYLNNAQKEFYQFLESSPWKKYMS